MIIVRRFLSVPGSKDLSNVLSTTVYSLPLHLLLHRCYQLTTTSWAPWDTCQVLGTKQRWHRLGQAYARGTSIFTKVPVSRGE